MAAITTINQFKGELYLPNVTIASRAEAIRLNDSIEHYEPVFLKTIFGYDLYTLFTAGLLSTDPLYEAIRDGGTYFDLNGIEQEWLGFTSEHYNPIANYIYFNHRKNYTTDTQGTGEYSNTQEDGTTASVYPKMVNAWNDMVDMNKALHGYLYANASSYPSYRYLTSDTDGKYIELFTYINTLNL